MELSEQFLKKVIGDYFKSEFTKILPEIIKDVVKSNPLFVGQEFISIQTAMERYNLSRKTIYNYHNRGYILLHTTEGKTFVSVLELETHIRNHPLPKKVDYGNVIVKSA